MSSEERGQWVYLVAIGLTYAAYVAIVFRQATQTPIPDIDYIPTMLGAIGIGIALSIVGRIAGEIAGHVAEPSDSHEPDVRDRDIGRFGEYVAGTVLGIGMIVPFVLTLAEVDYFWIANTMYFAFVVSALVGAVMKLVAYRRGI
jgi:hypothetical protein